MVITSQGRKILVDGVSLAKLSPNEVATITQQMKAEQRLRLMDNLDRAKITGETFFNEVDAFDHEAWGYARWVGSLPDKDAGDPGIDGILEGADGLSRVIDLAGRKEHGDKWPEVYAEMDIELRSLWEIAARLSGIRVTTQPIAQNTETQQAEPQRPSVAAA